MLTIAEALLASLGTSLEYNAPTMKMMNNATNKMTIEPVIARGIIFLFGQLFLMPLTKFTIEMIKHGIKIANIAQMMAMTTIHRRIPTNKIPMNAMLLIYLFYEFIAIFLELETK